MSEDISCNSTWCPLKVCLFIAYMRICTIRECLQGNFVALRSTFFSSRHTYFPMCRAENWCLVVSDSRFLSSSALVFSCEWFLFSAQWFIGVLWEVILVSCPPVLSVIIYHEYTNNCFKLVNFQSGYILAARLFSLLLSGRWYGQ